MKLCVGRNFILIEFWIVFKISIFSVVFTITFNPNLSMKIRQHWFVYVVVCKAHVHYANSEQFFVFAFNQLIIDVEHLNVFDSPDKCFRSNLIRFFWKINKMLAFKCFNSAPILWENRVRCINVLGRKKTNRMNGKKMYRRRKKHGVRSKCQIWIINTLETV